MRDFRLRNPWNISGILIAENISFMRWARDIRKQHLSKTIILES